MSSDELMPGGVWCPQAGYAKQRCAAGEGLLVNSIQHPPLFHKEGKIKQNSLQSLQYQIVLHWHTKTSRIHREQTCLTLQHHTSKMYLTHSTHHHHWSDLWNWSTQYETHPGVLRLARDSSGFPARGDATRGLPESQERQVFRMSLKRSKFCILHWGRDCPGVAEIVKTESNS